MNSQEIAKLASICFTNYPNNSTSLKDVIASWSFSLADVPYEAASEALKLHMLESPFFPHASDIYTRVIEQTDAIPDASDAWNMIQARIRSTYPGHPARDWDAPYPVRQAMKAMGGTDQLRHSERPGADRHQFIKDIYPVYRQRAIREVNVAHLIAHGAAALEPGFRPPVSLPDPGPEDDDRVLEIAG